MKYLIRDIWSLYNNGETICITTNGFVGSDGCAVMGRGTAYQATKMFPEISKQLGRLILRNGNVAQLIVPCVYSFPVKPQAGICNRYGSNVVPHMRKRIKPFEYVPGWAMMAEIGIIQASLMQLQWYHNHNHIGKIYVPKPGCGAGGLDWQKVKPWCEMFDDWLIIVDREDK